MSKITNEVSPKRTATVSTWAAASVSIGGAGSAVTAAALHHNLWAVVVFCTLQIPIALDATANIVIKSQHWLQFKRMINVLAEKCNTVDDLERLLKISNEYQPYYLGLPIAAKSPKNGNKAGKKKTDGDQNPRADLENAS